MSKLDKLGGLKAIKESSSSWSGTVRGIHAHKPDDSIECSRCREAALIERIEYLEAELAECKNQHTIKDAHARAEMKAVKAELKPLRELLDMATKALDSAETMWRSSQPRKLDEALSWRENDTIAENLIANFRAKARECKALEVKTS